MMWHKMCARQIGNAFRLCNYVRLVNISMLAAKNAKLQLPNLEHPAYKTPIYQESQKKEWSIHKVF